MQNPDAGERDVTARADGWRSQSPWLKAMLTASLVLIAVGVYRCSSELVPAEGPRRIRVETATMAVPDSLLAVPADSFAVLATRMFARGLREASTAEVAVGEDPSAWAVVRLHIKALPDGRIELLGTAASVVGGHRMAAFNADGSPDQMREMADVAAGDLAGELGVENPSPAGRR